MSAKTFGRGDRSETVVRWQRYLTEKGFVDGLGAKLVDDGQFGPKTEFATISYQLANHLTPTGFVDLETLAFAQDFHPVQYADGREVDVVRTTVTLFDYANAVRVAWARILEELDEGEKKDMGEVSNKAIAVLWAQYKIETGGAACWNWNIGNVKKFPGDGYDYQCLKGVWEGVSQEEAKRLIETKQARLDPSTNHAIAVGKGRVSVIFNPPHPQTRFRAYPSLSEAMYRHIQLLARKRFASAWSSVVAGDPDGFAKALKKKGYFTASAESYAAGMRPAFVSALKVLDT